MSTTLRVVTMSLTVAIWMALPQGAQAHTVGGGVPLATAHTAVITHLPDGVAARVVDGDQRLELAVNPHLTLVVRGLLGEPFLMFSAAGVFENLNSPTTYLDRPIPQQPPRGLVHTLPPRWSQLTSGHTHIWHEDRLHALAGIDARTRWSIPVTVEGRAAAISGELRFAPTPTRLWLWPVAAAVACAAALLRLRSTMMTLALARGAALLAIPAVLILRLGRQLQGHPNVTLLQHADTVATVAGAVLLGYLLVRGDGRSQPAAAFIIAAFGIYQGLATLPALTDGSVLMAEPAVLARGAAVVALAAGFVALVSVVCVGTPNSTAATRV